jgi:thiosulfate/3-mercaptopyruvate sulfurtransferase
MRRLRTLIDAPTLLALQRSDAPLVLLDCGFDLLDRGAGERAYAAGHIPGAHYLHLERDLSGAEVDASGRYRGRHPLPAIGDWAATVARLGIAPGVPVVVYDAQGGATAARAWWMLRWLGHDAVALLDGGIQAWRAAGGTLDTAVPPRDDHAPPYPAPAPAMPTIDTDPLLARLPEVVLIDARAGERFRGEVEPFDAVAGHIPGALNRPFTENLGPDGRFKPEAQLRAELAPLTGGRPEADVIQQCGSGVTACHNLLAFEHIGLGTTVLYPGSWSEWCDDESRPMARG